MVFSHHPRAAKNLRVQKVENEIKNNISSYPGGPAILYLKSVLFDQKIIELEMNE